MICEYSLFKVKSFHKSYLNYVTGDMNSIKLLLRRTLVRLVILINIVNRESSVVSNSRFTSHDSRKS